MNIDKDSSEIAKILDKMDPNNHENITFSQCVALFSMVLIFHIIFFEILLKGKNHKG